MCNVWKKEEKVIYLHVIHVLWITPTCTLKAESFGHLISTEKKIIRLLTDGVTNNDYLKDEFKKKIKLT